MELLHVLGTKYAMKISTVVSKMKIVMVTVYLTATNKEDQIAEMQIWMKFKIIHNPLLLQ